MGECAVGKGLLGCGCQVFVFNLGTQQIKLYFQKGVVNN